MHKERRIRDMVEFLIGGNLRARLAGMHQFDNNPCFERISLDFPEVKVEVYGQDFERYVNAENFGAWLRGKPKAGDPR